MNIIKKSPDKYGLYKVGKNCHRIVKNLKDYSDEQEAISDLVKLLDGEIKEQDLTGGSFEQEAEAGKQGNRILCLEAALEGIRDSLIDSLILTSEDVEKAAREAIKRINEVLGERRKKG